MCQFNCRVAASEIQFQNLDFQSFSSCPTLNICCSVSFHTQIVYVQDLGKTEVKHNVWNSMEILLFSYQNAMKLYLIIW